MSKLLLEWGANVNFRNNKEEVPLYWAVQSGKFQVNRIIAFKRIIATFIEYFWIMSLVITM